LGKGKKRAIDKEQSPLQRSLFKDLSKEAKEVIRFEIRLNQKQKMNKVLTDLGYKKNPVFKDVFNTEMSQKVVKDYWDKLIKGNNLGLFSMTLSPKDILQTLLLADKKIKPKQAIYLFGLFTLAKDENGMRQLRTITSKRATGRTWYRIAKDTQLANNLITKNRVRSWVKQIDKKIEDYKPYKIKT
jgi:hypothetical protein